MKNATHAALHPGIKFQIINAFKHRTANGETDFESICENVAMDVGGVTAAQVTEVVEANCTQW